MILLDNYIVSVIRCCQIKFKINWPFLKLNLTAVRSDITAMRNDPSLWLRSKNIDTSPPKNIE